LCNLNESHAEIFLSAPWMITQPNDTYLHDFSLQSTAHCKDQTAFVAPTERSLGGLHGFFVERGFADMGAVLGGGPCNVISKAYILEGQQQLQLQTTSLPASR
jgi:hypothetical protein